MNTKLDNQAGARKVPKKVQVYAASLVVALGILLSRISGLVRERAIAHFLGNTQFAGAFKAALRIPNFLQNLFGEGVLSASFIPVYVQLRESLDRKASQKLASVVGSLLAVATSILVLLGVWLTPIFVDLVAPGFGGDVRTITIQLVRVLFPGVGLLVMSAWCLGILNSHGRFFLSYAAPVLWNLSMVAALLVYGGSSSPRELVVRLAWASVVGSVLQLAIQLPFVYRCVGGTGALRPLIDLSFKPVRTVFKNLLPVMMSRGVVQLSAYIDGMIASFLGPTAVACISYAQTIYLLPISLFGMSVAAAELPQMSITAQDHPEARQKLRERLIGGRRNIAFFVVPSAVAFLFLGRSVVAALYQSGAFTAEDTLYVWYVLIGSVVGLLAATWGRLYASAFYALGDTRTPFRFAVIRVVLTTVLGAAFAFPLRWIYPLLLSYLGLPIPKFVGINLHLGAIGLTSSAGFAGWIEYLLLSTALGKKIGSTPLPRSFMLRVWIVALLAAGVAFTADGAFFGYGERELWFLRYNFVPLIVLGIFGMCYVLLSYCFHIDEVRKLVGPLARLLRRR